MNNVSFSGRLDVSAMTTNKKQWKQVAKFFEEKTKAHPNEEMSLQMYDDALGYELWSDVGSRAAAEGLGSLSEEGTQMLFKLSPKQIANRLAKLMGIYRKEQQTVNMFSKLVETLEKNDKKGVNEDIFGNSYDKIFSLAFDKAKVDKDDALAADKILQHIDYNY